MLKESDFLRVNITDDMLKEAERRALALSANKKFMKVMADRMGLEKKTIEQIVWGSAWCFWRAKEYAAIDYEIDRRIKLGEITAAEVDALYKNEIDSKDEYQRKL
jgi:hypothetical protein